MATISIEEVLSAVMAQTGASENEVRKALSLSLTKADPETKVSLETLGGMFLTLSDLAVLYQPVSKVSRYSLLGSVEKAEYNLVPKAERDAKGEAKRHTYLNQENRQERLEASHAYRLKMEAEAILASYGYTGDAIAELASKFGR